MSASYRLSSQSYARIPRTAYNFLHIFAMSAVSFDVLSVANDPAVKAFLDEAPSREEVDQARDQMLCLCTTCRKRGPRKSMSHCGRVSARTCRVSCSCHHLSHVADPYPLSSSQCKIEMYCGKEVCVCPIIRFIDLLSTKICLQCQRIAW